MFGRGLSALKEKIMSEPPEAIPPGSWGGDLVADDLDREYRQQQQVRMERLHTQEKVRQEAASAAVDQRAINERAAELRVQAELQKSQEPPQKPKDPVFDGIGTAGRGDGGQDAFMPPPREQPVSAPLETTRTLGISPGILMSQEGHNDVPPTRQVERGAANENWARLHRRSPEFMAGQAILSLSSLRELAETGSLSPETMVECMRTCAELQFALAEALPAAMAPWLNPSAPLGK